MITLKSEKVVGDLRFGNAIVIDHRVGEYETVYFLNGIEMSFKTDSLQEAARVAEKAVRGEIGRGEILWHIMRRTGRDEAGAKLWAKGYLKLGIRGKHRKIGRRDCEACNERRITGGARVPGGVVWLCATCSKRVSADEASRELVFAKTGYRDVH